MFYKILFFLALLCLIQSVQANPPFYFLCGTDEDGCPDGDEQFCACIPANSNWKEPYCLDFDHMTCVPFIKEHPNCIPTLKFNNQGECLATIFQSEPHPTCRQESLEFCRTHSTYICDENGNPDSCKKMPS